MRHDQFAAPFVLLTRGSDFTLNELVDSYMACYRGRDSNFGQRIQFFTNILGDKPAHLIEADDVADALEHLQRRGAMHNKSGRSKGGAPTATGRELAPATVNRYRCCLQAVLSWARKKRLMPKGWVNPVGEIERLPEDNARTRYLSESEYDRLLKAARVSYWKKLHLLIKMAVTTGARKGALMGLRWRDLELDAGDGTGCGRAFVERNKNGEPFVLVLLPEVVLELKALKSRSQPDDLVFCGRDPSKQNNFTKAWHNALEAAGIEGVCFHSLRHTHASWLAKSGKGLLEIADSLGHKSLAMTKRYSHLCIDSRQQMLRSVFAA